MKNIFLVIMLIMSSISYVLGSSAASNPHSADEIIVRFKPGTPANRIDRLNSLHGTAVGKASKFNPTRTLKIPAGNFPQQMVELYRSSEIVEYAEVNYIAKKCSTPNDPYYSLQWNLKSPTAGINIEPAWNITTGSSNTIIAVIDTGVAYEDFRNYSIAPDLADTAFVPGYDFVRNDTHPNDDDGHGTHVTGTIAQSTNNGAGTAGIAYSCSIMPIKVLDRKGSGDYFGIAEGIYFATDNGAKVINMSLGGSGNSNILRDAVAYAYNNGVTIVCAAGNEYQQGNAPSYPAAYNEYCIAVGATRYDRARAYYSNTGSYVDLVAPGGDINVDQNGDTYGDGILQQTFDNQGFGYFFYQGTSMASPHIAGVAALLYSAGVTKPDDIRQAMQNTARDLGPTGYDTQFGHGLVDAYAALTYFPVPGDFNDDRLVNVADLGILLSDWLGSNPETDIAPAEPDGQINLLDLSRFAEYYFQNNP
ncbi:MAG: peptidase S8 [Anaerohalosphaera sp.]|nr:peptidase S8 [Anaerohalosphaera sp.]